MSEKFIIEDSQFLKLAYSSSLKKILIFSPKKILSANPTFLEISEYASQELYQLKLSDIVSKEFKIKAKTLEKTLLKNESISILEKF
ncbi:MAG: hypothetical protein J7K10_01150, partial [Thermodesulfobacterium sp.]|nr:hypothetical protein [Thermodesulfobacterium sp.]